MRNPIFDIDNWQEIAATLGRNRTRTFLTGLGIFWGTVMLALMWGGAQGLEDIMQRQFNGLSTNMAIIASERTTLPFRGYGKGRLWSMTLDDLAMIKRAIPEVEAMSGLKMTNVVGSYGSKSASVKLQGVESDYASIFQPILYYGRFLNRVDEVRQRKVAVIGRNIADEFFQDKDPVGEYMNIGGVYYRIIGVAGQQSEANFNGRIEDQVIIPISTFNAAVNGADKRIDGALVKFDSRYRPEDFQARIVRILSVAHTFDPDDETAVAYINLSQMFDAIDKVFTGVDVLVVFVGLCSLIAGIIGVGNIMWIIVKERTKEIGIRRALGATPRDIIAQILSEGMVLTAIAGTAGICFSALVLGIAAKLTAIPGSVPGFQLSPAGALVIMGVFLVLGTLAGIPPAVKGMKIKPVEAMNDK